MNLKGFATSLSTQAVCNNYNQLQYNSLGKTGLLISAIGFGCYRIDVNSDVNRESLEKALLSGINLIDTSSTYTDGNSELLIGNIIQDLVAKSLLSRESLVIITKAGYLQGQNYRLSRLRKTQNNPFKDLVLYQEGLEHCIHPDFLENQITSSLKRLKIDCIDVYLLHNPEYYLKWAEMNKIDIQEARDEYYSRIKKAFQYLETEVAAGRIKYYGISSNTFPGLSSDYEFTSLSKVIQIANQIAVNNHFAVIQFPMNLLETGAYNTVNQDNGLNLLQLAKKNNLGVLINRPLNAIAKDQLIKLAQPSVFKIINPEEILTALENLKLLESSILQKISNSNDRENLQRCTQALFVYKVLSSNWSNFNNISNWQHAFNFFFLPQFKQYKDNFKPYIKQNNPLEKDLLLYESQLSMLYILIGDFYNCQQKKLSDKIQLNLSKIFNEDINKNKLSNLAIRALRSTEGVSSVLSGMTKPMYVLDAIEELKIPVSKYFNWGDIPSVEKLLSD